MTYRTVVGMRSSRNLGQYHGSIANGFFRIVAQRYAPLSRAIEQDEWFYNSNKAFYTKTSPLKFTIIESFAQFVVDTNIMTRSIYLFRTYRSG